jgi:hypothetical protein
MSAKDFHAWLPRSTNSRLNASIGLGQRSMRPGRNFSRGSTDLVALKFLLCHGAAERSKMPLL